MKWAFHPEARIEYIEAARFYAAARPGLGAEFSREVERVIAQICEAPLRGRIVGGGLRRCLTRRFPYALLYAVEKDCILIIAVMHGSRKPGYWRKRVE